MASLSHDGGLGRTGDGRQNDLGTRVDLQDVGHGFVVDGLSSDKAQLSEVRQTNISPMNVPAASAPIACNLSALSDRERHQTLSNLLRAAVSGRAELPDGFAYSLRGDRIGIADLGEWIGLERQCCPFLNFELSVSSGDVLWWLTLTGPEGTKSILEREFPA